MLYRFQSRVTADLLMLQPVAERVLGTLGKEISGSGIITWAEIPSAICRLKAEAERELKASTDSTDSQLTSEPDQSADDTATNPLNNVQFRQRIAPLITVLERCHAAQKDLIWVA